MKRLLIILSTAAALTLAGCQNDTETVDTDGTIDTTNPRPPTDGVTGATGTDAGMDSGATVPGAGANPSTDPNAGTGTGTGTDTGVGTGTSGDMGTNSATTPGTGAGNP